MYSPARCVNIIIACAALHNSCRRNKVPMPDLPLEDMQVDEEDANARGDGEQNELLVNDVSGIETRARVVRECF